MITIVAARRLSPQAFGVFSLGSTLGWIVAVTTDFGIQLHLARAVARRPQDAAPLLAAWLRVRLWTAAAAMAVVSIGLLAAGWSTAFSVPIAVLALVYAVQRPDRAAPLFLSGPVAQRGGVDADAMAAIGDAGVRVGRARLVADVTAGVRDAAPRVSRH